MTTATPQDSRHRKVLLEAFSPIIVDAIDGRIRELSAEEAGRLIAPINDQLAELVAAQRANVATAAALDVPEKVKEEVQATSDKAKEAVKAINVVIDKVEAGQPVAEADVEQVATKVAEADAAVKKASKTLDGRVGDLEQDVTGLTARVDQLEACQGELQVVSASAFASVQTASEPGDRAGQAALITYAVSFVLYAFLVMVSGLDWHWTWAIGLPAIIAGLVGALVYRSLNEVQPHEATVAAQAIVTRWAGQEAGASPSIVLADEEEAAQLTSVSRVKAAASAFARTR